MSKQLADTQGRIIVDLEKGACIRPHEAHAFHIFAMHEEADLLELEFLWLRSISGMGALTGVGQDINHILVQDWHSQVQHSHDQDDDDAHESTQLQDSSLGPDIGNCSA